MVTIAENEFLIDTVEKYLNKKFKLLIDLQFGNLIIPKLTTGNIVSVGAEVDCFGVVFDINVDDDKYWIIKRNKFKEKILNAFFKNKILEEETQYHSDGRKVFLIEVKQFHDIKNELKVY